MPWIPNWDVEIWEFVFVVLAFIFAIYAYFKEKETMYPILELKFDNELRRDGTKRCFITIENQNKRLPRWAILKRYNVENGEIRIIDSKKLKDTLNTRSGGYLPDKLDTDSIERIFYLEYKSVRGNRYFSYLHLIKTVDGSWLPIKENDLIIAERKRIWQTSNNILNGLVENDK